MSLDIELFKGTTLSDLFKDIYDNSKKKDRQCNTLIAELRPLIKNSGDATIIVPLIKEYLEIAVKNDDHLVKLAAIAQRLAAPRDSGGMGDGLLTDEEKRQLLNEIDSIQDSLNSPEEKISDYKATVEQTKQFQSAISNVNNSIETNTGENEI